MLLKPLNFPFEAFFLDRYFNDSLFAPDLNILDPRLLGLDFNVVEVD